jgi:hypothetical protein
MADDTGLAPDDTGLAPKESVIEALCGWSDGLAVGGFRVATSIPRVRLRRGRPLDPESRHRRAFFARHPTYVDKLELAFETK